MLYFNAAAVVTLSGQCRYLEQRGSNLKCRRDIHSDMYISRAYLLTYKGTVRGNWYDGGDCVEKDSQGQQDCNT